MAFVQSCHRQNPRDFYPLHLFHPVGTDDGSHVNDQYAYPNIYWSISALICRVRISNEKNLTCLRNDTSFQCSSVRLASIELIEHTGGNRSHNSGGGTLFQCEPCQRCWALCIFCLLISLLHHRICLHV